MSVDTSHEIELDNGRRVHGFVDDGFGPVMDAFVSNFVERHDLGAGCAVFVDGRPVVDVWGGTADRRTGRPWEHDTAAVIFSCSKGLLAICAYLLVEDGRLDLDAPIEHYWNVQKITGLSRAVVTQPTAHGVDNRATLDAIARSNGAMLGIAPILGARVVPNGIVYAILAFIFLYFATVTGATFLLMVSGLEAVTAFSAVIAWINNMGPGLNEVGPAANFAGLSAFQKWVGVFTMLAGRLELFTILVLFTRGFWRR